MVPLNHVHTRWEPCTKSPQYDVHCFLVVAGKILGGQLMLTGGVPYWLGAIVAAELRLDALLLVYLFYLENGSICVNVEEAMTANVHADAFLFSSGFCGFRCIDCSSHGVS
jgi:hypothetical protein